MDIIKRTIIYYKKYGLFATILGVIHVVSGAKYGKYIYDESSEKKTYDYFSLDEYQENIDFSAKHTNIKPIAFYLPQYHVIKENNIWWGDGYTEWTVVKRALPKFKGQYQPRIPHKDIGYYNLSDYQTLSSQAKLAKQHGVYGFCMYYYWFSGKTLLEKPLELLLEHQEIDINFCLCWANENWTRTWSGDDQDVLIHQNYSDDDPIEFIHSIKKYLIDDRYIRIKGHPMLLIYNIAEIPNPVEFITSLRTEAKQSGIGDLYILICNTNKYVESHISIDNYVDGFVDFPPHGIKNLSSIGINNTIGTYEGGIYDYKRLVDNICAEYNTNSEKEIFRTCMMAWDNSSRRDTGWNSFCNYSIYSFYRWIRNIVYELELKHNENSVFFINAWNEWSEGTYLEPDARYGYANINTFSRALFKENINYRNIETADYGINLAEIHNDKKIAIQVHVYYTDTLDLICTNLKVIPFEYDLYISACSEEKKKYIESTLELNKINRYCVEIYPNKGRDVMPFLLQMQKRYNNYDYICHIHSKKTTHKGYGDCWRDYLYGNLLGNEKNVRSILDIFDKNEKVGLIYPDTYPLLKEQEEWGGNEEDVIEIFKKIGIDYSIQSEVAFPVGDMFWMRTRAIHKIFDYKWEIKDFPNEEGQINNTIMHGMERVWSELAIHEGYIVNNIFNRYYLQDERDGKYTRAEKRMIDSYLKQYKDSYMYEDLKYIFRY